MGGLNRKGLKEKGGRLYGKEETGGQGRRKLFHFGQAHDRLMTATPTFTRPQWTPQSRTS